MAVLICSFASHRSTPEKQQRWIAYLEEKRRKHLEDAASLSIIDLLLHKARTWD